MARLKKYEEGNIVSILQACSLFTIDRQIGQILGTVCDKCGHDMQKLFLLKKRPDLYSRHYLKKSRDFKEIYNYNLGSMRIRHYFSHLFVRLRYPVSLPQDIARATGLNLVNTLEFHQILNFLTNPNTRPTKLFKYMPREMAEKLFDTATRKECFSESSIFSFYFNQGWLEFDLHYDELSRLRRVYLHHKLISDPQGVEIPLNILEESFINSTPLNPQGLTKKEIRSK